MYNELSQLKEQFLLKTEIHNNENNNNIIQINSLKEFLDKNIEMKLIEKENYETKIETLTSNLNELEKNKHQLQKQEEILKTEIKMKITNIENLNEEIYKLKADTEGNNISNFR